MDTLFIFGAKYLFILSVIIAGVFLYLSTSEVRQKLIIFCICCFPISFLISLVARELYYNPRPFVSGGYNPLISHIADNGFPSDHALFVFTIAAVILFFHKKLGVYFFAIAVLVGISRVYVGVHHPLDILASLMIALSSAYLANIVVNRKKDAIIPE